MVEDVSDGGRMYLMVGDVSDEERWMSNITRIC
jgi:hypothetical protein